METGFSLEENHLTARLPIFTACIGAKKLRSDAQTLLGDRGLTRVPYATVRIP